MSQPIRILLQTTIPAIDDDWHIGRFGLLRDYLAALRDAGGASLCEVTARNRDAHPARPTACCRNTLWLAGRPVDMPLAA